MLDELLKSEEKEIQVIVFKLGQEEYATPIMNVQEVIIPQSFTGIPDAPYYIEGVINLRGNIIPVIDGRKRFHLDTTEEIDALEQRIMIMDSEEGVVGLIVDNVSDVIRLQVEDIEPPPVDMGDSNDIFWGIGRYQDKLLILLNCEKGLNFKDEQGIQDFQNITEVVKRTKNEEKHSGNTAKSK